MTSVNPLHEPPRVRRLATALGLLLLGVSLSLALNVSKRTGPSLEESSRLDAVRLLEPVVIRVAQDGFFELGSLANKGRFAGLNQQSTFPLLLAAWSKLGLGAAGILDPTSAARLPWLVLGASVPWLVFLLVRPSRGPWVALLAGVWLLLMPSWAEASAVGRTGAALAGCWFLVLVPYARSLGAPSAGWHSGPAPMTWALLGALAFGIGVAVDLATSWILPLVLLHFGVTHFSSVRRALPRGRLPTPLLVCFALPIAPAFVVGLNPLLWGASSTALARWLLSPLGAALKLPGDASSLTASLSVVSVVFALLGILLLGWRALGPHFSTDSLPRERDGLGLGALALLGLAISILVPKLVPIVFLPRAELALPFLAILASTGFAGLVGVLGAAWRHSRRARAQSA